MITFKEFLEQQQDSPDPQLDKDIQAALEPNIKDPLKKMKDAANASRTRAKTAAVAGNLNAASSIAAKATNVASKLGGNASGMTT